MEEDLENIREKIKMLDYGVNRKRWMRAFILLVLVDILPCAVLAFFSGGSASVAFFLALGIGVHSIVMWFPTYFLGYQREGTKWLLWILIVLPLGLFRSYGLAGVFAPILILLSPIYIYFWMKTFKLRQQNLLKKMDRKFESEKLSKDKFLISARKLVKALG